MNILNAQRNTNLPDNKLPRLVRRKAAAKLRQLQRHAASEEFKTNLTNAEPAAIGLRDFLASVANFTDDNQIAQEYLKFEQFINQLSHGGADQSGE